MDEFFRNLICPGCLETVAEGVVRSKHGTRTWEEKLAYSVLVVDDEDSIRALYQAELEEEGYQVFCASDGDAALKILDGELIHVVVLDIKLRGESGLQVLQNIVRRHKETPVILSTAYGSYKDDFSSWLAEAYVVKSSNLNELKEQVAKILGRRYGAGTPN
jgi:DNA-binding response OmpR family regulator